MNWNFHLPVELVFGSGTRHEIKSYIEKIGGTRGVLVCGKSFLRNGTADAFLQAADGALVSVFSDIRPNPTTENVNACAAEMRRVEADFFGGAGRRLADGLLQGGLCHCPGTDNIEPYHNGDKPVTAEEAIPMIAFATTAGTASEVTNISVLTNVAAGVKKTHEPPGHVPQDCCGGSGVDLNGAAPGDRLHRTGCAVPRGGELLEREPPAGMCCLLRACGATGV